MSEGGGSTGPDLGPNYQNSGTSSYSNPPSQPPTPSSTVQDPPNYQNADVSENSNDSKSNVGTVHTSSASGLPPFSSFVASDVTEGLGGRLAGDGYLTSDGITSTRVMELSGWDYCYTDSLSGRYLERADSMPVMIPQAQYRPWESKQDGSSESIKSTLPSFQSQFGEELVTTLTTLTPAACSPAPSVPSPSLPSFHTLSAVNPRYPLVPAPVQAREIPSIQQQFLDERHIHLFQGPPGQNFALQPQNGLNGQTLTSLNNGTTLTTLNNAQYHPQIINNAQILPSGQILAPQSHILAPSSQIITSNGHIITSSGGQGLTVVSQSSTPTVLTVVKTEPVNIVELKSSSSEPSNLTQLHHPNFQSPLIAQSQQMDSKFGVESPPRGVDGRKKERRKIRASSLESSNESDGAMSVESSGQVAAVSSTAGFKSPMTPGQMNNEGDGMITDTGDKQTKKKRKRCGECIGCQRKDNCGDCAPCRNDKSHQICKMRRCEKLTEKKHLLAYNREDGGVSYRGRGRGRGRGSRGGYRGKGARPSAQPAQVTSVVGEMNSAPGIVVGTNRDSVKVDSGRVSSGPIPANPPPIAPAMAVPFYAGTEVWSAPAPTDPWAPQGQFIHQIDDIRYQHYPGYQPAAGYQQAGFIAEQTSAFQPQYVNATNGNPATTPPQGNVTPRSTGSYTQVHTPTPSPNPPTPHVNGHRNGINVHYVEENYVNGTTFNSESSSMVPPPSTTPNSRSSSAHLEASETNSKTSGYMSGNEMPGYPLNSPQCQSSCNSSGYPGQSIQSEYGDQSTDGNSYQTSNGTNHSTQKSPSYTQASPGTYQNYQNYNSQRNASESHKSVISSMSPGSCHPSQKTSGMLSQNSSKNYNSNPSPQTYQEISPGQNRQNPPQYENRTGNAYQGEHQNYQMISPNSQNYGQSSPIENGSQEKCNVNARIKSMIMNKQQSQQQNQSNSHYGGSNEGNMMSPNREMKSPSQQNVQLMSPVRQNAGMMSPVHNSHAGIMSPNHHQNVTNTSPNSKESKSYVDKIQQNDYSEKKQVRVNENANHFLAFSHHLRDGSLLQPEGGGVQNWTGRPNTTGSNCQVNFQANHCEHFQMNKNLKFESNNENIPDDSAMKYDVSSDSRKWKTDYQNFESGGHYHENKPFQNCNVSGYESRNYYQPQQQQQPSDLIRALEANFPTKKIESGGTVSNCLFKQEALDNFKDCREQKVFPGYQNVVGSSCKVENSSYNAVVKQEGFRESGYCQFQNNYSGQESVSDFQTYKSNYSYAKSNCDEGEDTFPNVNLDYDKCGVGYGCEGYQKPYVKSEFDEGGTYCMNNFGYTSVKMEGKDFKSECFGMKTHFITSPTTKVEYPRSTLDCNARLESENENLLSGNETSKCLYPRISYAPNVRNMEVIDKRFIKRESEGKAKWEEYCKAREMEKSETDDVKEEKKNYLFEGDGGPIVLGKSSGAWCCRTGGIETPTAEHLRDGGCQGYQTADEFCPEKSENLGVSNGNAVNAKQSSNDCFEKVDSKSPGLDGFQENVERLRNNVRTDVPDCQCFPPDKCPPEPGSYYTHLGAAASLSDLRKDVETRTGQTGKALRIEKICYTGKEGKTTQGCPLAKWVIRRSGLDEKFLIIVKHRQGHTCSTAWIVVCLVAWEGVPTSEADKVYNLLSHKLNKFGLPTTRRCATNEPRTCACQGLDPDTCGASFSFGCSWSMYYNGCKYARSKTVRKFRLSVRSEEQEVEERMHVLATLLSPLYSTLAPDAFQNQTLFEREATECRLGFKPGRPFSGVTACIDFCAHSHRDLHNMNNGCTVVVTLTKHRSLSKPDDEQLHVLPLYIMDETDEFGCKESQEAKYKDGSIECLTKFPCEVRVRAVPLQPCRRHGKKRKVDEPEVVLNNMFKDMNSKNVNCLGMNNSASPLQSVDVQSMIDGLEMQLQSSQVSSTVMDSPVNMYQGWGYQNMPENEMCSGGDERWNRSWTSVESRKKQNWLNSNQTPPQWDYSGFPVQKDIDPDSTTNQYQAFSSVSSRSATTPGVSNCYSTYVSCKSPSLPSTYQSQSMPLWNQIPQTCGRKNHYPPANDNSKPRERTMMKTDEDRDCLRNRLGGLSPQTPSKHWTDYSSNQFPIHQNPSQFRMPRGRPPSTHNLVSVSIQNEIYPKPLVKDSNGNVSNFLFNNSTKGIDLKNRNSVNEVMKGYWLSKPGLADGNGNTLSAQNPFITDEPNFNPAQGYQCQKNNFLHSDLNSIYNYNENCTSESKPCFGNWSEYSGERCNGHRDTFNIPNDAGRWDAPRWDFYGSSPFFPVVPDAPKSEPIGEVTDYIDNEECFKDSQMGGVAIALGHGSVLFECAKHELHATTALKKPNRLHPTRISLVFYQHRNLNRAKHGWDEWEEKMRLRKLGINLPEKSGSKDGKACDETNAEFLKFADLDKPLGLGDKILLRIPTYTTTTWTTLFPMRPCMVTGPYQEGGTY